jgi:hypothetical protein
MFDLIDGIPILRYLTELNDENLAKEVMKSNLVQNALLELLDIKTTIRCGVVICSECKYSDFSKTVDYAYTCKNRISPCRNRLVSCDFGCVYGQKRERENDA